MLLISSEHAGFHYALWHYRHMGAFIYITDISRFFHAACQASALKSQYFRTFLILWTQADLPASGLPLPSKFLTLYDEDYLLKMLIFRQAFEKGHTFYFDFLLNILAAVWKIDIKLLFTDTFDIRAHFRFFAIYCRLICEDARPPYAFSFDDTLHIRRCYQRHKATAKASRTTFCA